MAPLYDITTTDYGLPAMKIRPRIMVPPPWKYDHRLWSPLHENTTTDYGLPAMKIRPRIMVSLRHESLLVVVSVCVGVEDGCGLMNKS